MKTEQEAKSVRDLVDLYKNKMLVTNPEYQRGTVWRQTHKKKLIDSVLRGYPLPLIYLHHIKKTVAGMQREDLEIIDGQQRITALYEFAEDNFSLFDPIKDDKEAKFPAFIKKQPCPWAGKVFSALDDALRERLLDTKLPIARIETDDANEVRDLFVRLQSGLPLNAQEMRDAWPGQFTEFVLQIGGKPELARYPGHQFFQNLMGLNPRTDRGKTRQFAAQIAMLFFSHRENGMNSLPDINADGINNFYFSNVDFDKNSPNAKRLVEIFDKLCQILANDKRPKLKGHDAMHLVLLADALWDDYSISWESKLPSALDEFVKGLTIAKAKKDGDSPDEFWMRYGQWTRVNSDRGDRIAYRHGFYSEKMHAYLAPLQIKDPRRLFGELERELIYFKNHKRCAVCGGEVRWDEVEIHHVIEHSRGGHTLLSNGALVHRHCHPKGRAETEAFAEKFHADQERERATSLAKVAAETTGYIWSSNNGLLFLPQGTDIRMTYKGEDFFATVERDGVVYNGDVISPATFANKVTNGSRNAWKELWIKFPDDDAWALADDLRRRSSPQSTEDLPCAEDLGL